MTENLNKLIDPTDRFLKEIVELQDDYKLTNISYQLPEHIESWISGFLAKNENLPIKGNKTIIRLFIILLRAIATQRKAVFLLNERCMTNLLRLSNDRRQTLSGSVFSSFRKSALRSGYIRLVKKGSIQKGKNKASLYEICDPFLLELLGLTPDYISEQKARYIQSWEGNVLPEDETVELETSKPEVTEVKKPETKQEAVQLKPVVYKEPEKVDFLNDISRYIMAKQTQDRFNAPFTNDFLHNKTEMINYINEIVTGYGDIFNWPLLKEKVVESVNGTKNPVMLQIVNEILQYLTLLEASEAKRIFNQNYPSVHSYVDSKDSCYIVYGEVYIYMKNYMFKDGHHSGTVQLMLSRAKPQNLVELVKRVSEYCEITGTINTGVITEVIDPDHKYLLIEFMAVKQTVS